MTQPVQYHYGKFPPQNIDWISLIPLIGPANAALARYDGTLSAIPNANVLLSPLSTQEAVLSSRIEGTQATMGEVLEFEAEGDPDNISSERREDINEILNYRKAMWRAIELLKELPLCQRLVKEVHRVLLAGVRGYVRSPGEYRLIPNWIGPPGCSIEEAKFVPISSDRLPEALGVWEKFIHEETPDPLVQLAIVHAEFEALHPFLDGNGRLGRMCVPLFMFERGLIQSPMFYVSAFFERNRDEYYERLLTISRDDDWTAWCKFFLRAVTEQASENQRKAIEILNLYETKKGEVTELLHSQYSIHALDYIFERPIFKSSDFTNKGDIPTPSAKRILGMLRDNGMLRILKDSSGRRPAVYSFPALLNIAEGKNVF
ncbi:Fic: filamentation induced by cAMP protein [Syntrophobacter sp. SbD1]|nr:Fic: filamentation induced by cAMP protein [Syntrophobacter sp. SbD1]